MGAQALNVAAWSPADVAQWLGSLGFDDLKAAALRNGVSGAQLQQLASTNMLNAIGATTLQSYKIRAELGIPTNNPGVAAPPGAPVASPFNPAPAAIDDKLSQTFESPKGDNYLPPAGATAVAGAAGAVVYQLPPGVTYPPPGSGAAPTTQTYFGAPLADADLLSGGLGASHSRISKQFSIAFIVLFILLIIWAGADIGINAPNGIYLVEYGITLWIGEIATLIAGVIFIILEVIIGFRGILKAVRGLAIAVVVTSAILGLFALITVAWYTHLLDYYGAFGYLTPTGQASLAMEWLLFITWTAVVGLGSARLFILFKKYSD